MDTPAGILVTADDVCRAAEATLQEHLPALATAAELEKVATWQQVPTIEALNTAALPGVAITSPGLARPPVKRRSGWDATWRLAIGVYARGADHASTATAVRSWAALVRAAVLQHPALGDLRAESTVWIGEDYIQLPTRASARTLGGCAVAFDVTVKNVVPIEPPPSPGDPPLGVPVATTRSTVSVRPPVIRE